MDNVGEQVIVIGAGPAGLAIAVALHHRGVTSLILEAGDTFGGTYAKVRPSMRLLSPVSFNSLPHMPLHKRGGCVNAGEFRDYLERYANTYPLNIRYQRGIESIEKEGESYSLLGENGERFTCRYVVLATGLSSFPNPLPAEFDGAAAPVVNALDFRDSEEHRGRRILVVGSGQSAFEPACVLADRAEVYIYLNQKLRSVPLTVLGVNIVYPLQLWEKLPVSWFPGYHNGKLSHPGFDMGIREAVKTGRVKLLQGRISAEGSAVRIDKGPAIEVDLIINATGYRYESGIAPEGIKRWRNGVIHARRNESVSHPGFFVLGHHCCGCLASPFLRGIRPDALRLAKRIGSAVADASG